MVKLPIRAGRIGLPYYPESDNRPDSALWVLEEEIRHCEKYGTHCLITFASPVRSVEDVSVMHFYKQTFAAAATVEEVLAACEAVRQERQSDTRCKQ